MQQIRVLNYGARNTIPIPQPIRLLERVVFATFPAPSGSALGKLRYINVRAIALSYPIRIHMALKRLVQYNYKKTPKKWLTWSGL